MASTFSPSEDQVFKAVERLLRTSGLSDWNCVSVVAEASRYCYKTFSGQIGTVRMDYLHDRIKDGMI
jgi:hypothetical protein